MTRPNLFTILLAAISAFWVSVCRADLPVFTVMHSFASGGPGDLTPSHNVNQDGSCPEAPLTQGSDGALYGTISSGGANGTGIIFKIKSGGTGFTVLHSFGSRSSYSEDAVNTDGLSPEGALVQDSSGNLYGVMGGGGAESGGTLYKVKSDGSDFVILHMFHLFGMFGVNEGGCAPLGITLGSDGLLYGVTALGDQNGEGMIYAIKTDGTSFRILHTFSSAIFGDNDNSDGAHPTSALATKNGSVFYGTTLRGGKQGCGVIFEISTGGKGFGVLHDFRRKPKNHKNSAADPNEAVTVGEDGCLYANTQREGNSDGGAIFRLKPANKEFVILHSFSGTEADNGDASLPAGPVVFGRDGHIYGISEEGGSGGAGMVFRLSADGAKFFIQHDFSALDRKLTNSDGSSALAGLILGHDGNLYGVSAFGGTAGAGTIFRVTFPAAK